MNFNRHYNLDTKHAFLSASKYHWVGYTDDKLIATYGNHLATMRGTELHDFANHAIRLGIKLPKSKQTLNLFVNDAIGYRMNSEQVLYYSDNCFGTADAVSFVGNKLRIHDLKTGVTPASMKQLEIYTALFCLEYGVEPEDIDIELRIYQNDMIAIYEPEKESIRFVMDKIIRFDKLIDEIKKE